MINITRHPDSPKSLETPEIKKYIDNIILHLDNTDNYPKPNKPASYRSSDLLAAFDRDFFSKCYLTEMRFINSDAMDVEHFVPQNERSDLIYEWSNLFPADHYSNMIKPRKTPAGGYLKPCDPNDDVENEIIYTLSASGEEPQFDPRDNTNAKAINTCGLLDRVHNGHDVTTTNATVNLRHSIHIKYVAVLNKIIEWFDCDDGTQDKMQAERELKGLLSRKSSFTMLIRSMPAVRRLPEVFFD